MGAEPGSFSADPPVAVVGPWQVALGALLLTWCWMAFQANLVYGGNWSGLFYISAEIPLPPELRDGVVTRPAFRGYDGQLYRVIAHDPWPPFQYNASLDLPTYRRQRVLVPALAWALALGRQDWIDAAYIAVVLASAGAGVWFSALWFASHGIGAWWGMLFLVTPAALTSVDRMGIDGTLLALTVGGAVMWRRQQWSWMWILLALAGLTRETGILVAGGVALGLWAQREWRRGLVMACAALPALAWALLLRMWIGGYDVGTPDFLYAGIMRELILMEAHPSQWGARGAWLLKLAGLAGLGLCVPLMGPWFRRTSELWWAAVGFVPLALLLGAHTYLETPVAFGRALAPMLCFILFEGMRRWSWWGLSAAAVSVGPLAYSGKALLVGVGLM